MAKQDTHFYGNIGKCKTGHPLLSANIYNRRKGLTHRQHPVVRTPSGPDPLEYSRKEPLFSSQEIYGCPFIFVGIFVGA